MADQSNPTPPPADDATAIVRYAEQIGRSMQNGAKPNPEQTPEQFQQAGREFQQGSRRNG